MNYKTNKSCKLAERCPYVDCDSCERIKTTLGNAICGCCEMNEEVYPESKCIVHLKTWECDLRNEIVEKAFVDIVKELI